MKHIFVSYAHSDKDFARQLTSRLRESGRTPWQDLRDLRGGDYWQNKIDEALEKAEALVVVMSPQAAKSPYVTYEWAFGLGAGVPVIPVVVKKRTVLHPRLSSIQYIDFTTRRAPWVDLRKALPGRPSTIQIGRPEIRAKFNIVGGKPEKQGDYYVITVFIHQAPRAANLVTYEFHDETLKRVKWPSRAAAANFELANILSNGDSLLTASIRTSGRKPLRIASSLYDALRRGHGSHPSPRIKSALRKISESSKS